MNKRRRKSSFRPVRENQEITPSTDFLTLNDDCLYKIFDWLSLEELTCVNMTCKRLQTVSGVYFEREYQLLKLTITGPNYGGHIEYKPDEEQFPYVEQFKRHFKTVQLDGVNIRLFRHAAMLFQNKSIKHLYLKDFSTNIGYMMVYGLGISYEIQYGEIIKDILKNVVTLQTNVIDADNLHDIFLKHCLHLENLIINRNGTDGFTNTLPLFNQTYPTLRKFHIKISPEASEKLWVDLQRFIENNTSLEVLFYFEQGKQCKSLIPLIQNHDLKVKELALRLFPARLHSEEAKMLLNKNCEILSALKDKNNYDKLQLIIGNKQVILAAPHMLQSLKNLHKVYMISEKMYNLYDQTWENLWEYLCDQSISILSTLVHIETLLIKKLECPTHAEILAKGLVNLNEIFINSKNIEVILPFVRYSPKLTMIYIFNLYEQYLYPQENPNNLNVTTLIRERNKLSNATPLKIYVHRHLFLKMKRPATFFANDTVEIKRIESYSLRNPAILDSIIGAGYAGIC